MKESLIKPKYYGKTLDVAEGTKTIRIDPFLIAKLYELDFIRGSALKYILRAGNKSGEDEVKEIRKAITCLQRSLDDIESA